MATRSELRQRRRGGAAAESEERTRVAEAEEREDVDEDAAMLTYDKGESTQSREKDDTEGQLELLYRIVSEYVTKYVISLREMIGRLLVSSPAEGNSSSLSPHAEFAIDALESLQKTPFDAQDKEHEALLKELWELLLPSVPYERISKQWGRLGFQGKDPATDVRGGGILSLQNLLHLTHIHLDEVRGLVHNTGADGSSAPASFPSSSAYLHDSFPLSIAAINISALLFGLVRQSPQFANSLFEHTDSPQVALETYNKLFALIFLEFTHYHRRAIEEFIAQGGIPQLAVMQFNSVRAKFFDELKRQIGQGNYSDKVEKVREMKSRPAGANANPVGKSGGRRQREEEGNEEEDEPLIDLSD